MQLGISTESMAGLAVGRSAGGMSLASRTMVVISLLAVLACSPTTLVAGDTTDDHFRLLSRISMTEADCVQVDDDTGDDCSAWPPVSSGTVYSYEVEETFGSAVLSRRFKAYVPSRVTSPSPLLIYLHGGTGNGQQQLLSKPFASFADGRPWSWRPNTDSCQFVSPTWPYYKNPATNATCLPPVVDITYGQCAR